MIGPLSALVDTASDAVQRRREQLLGVPVRGDGRFVIPSLLLVVPFGAARERKDQRLIRCTTAERVDLGALPRDVGEVELVLADGSRRIALPPEDGVVRFSVD